MAEGSKIEWTDHTFNPWTGCTKITPGCDHCYAESWAKRSGHVRWGNHDRKRTTPHYWKAPVLWNQNADQFEAAHGRRQRVFCASLADVFDNQAETAWRDDLFKLIRQTPRLDWLLLTKRPFNISKFLPSDWGNGYDNVWLGLTAEDQERFDARWQYLEAVPSVVRFVSYEPAIGPLRISEAKSKPDWLIVGGESGPGARPMQAEWVRAILSECHDLRVAAFFKQWGSVRNNPLFAAARCSNSEQAAVDPYGKGGGLIDGRLVREFPVVSGAYRFGLAAE